MSHDINCTDISNVAGTNADPESGPHPRVPRRGRGGDLESGILRMRSGRGRLVTELGQPSC